MDREKGTTTDCLDSKRAAGKSLQEDDRNQDDMVNQIVLLRRKICPKSSYTTSGTSSLILVVSDYGVVNRRALNDLIVSIERKNEFEGVDTVNGWTESSLATVNGNVVLLYGIFKESTLEKIEGLLVHKQTKLVLQVLPHAVGSDAVSPSAPQDMPYVTVRTSNSALCKFSQKIGEWNVSWTYLQRGAATTIEALRRKAFNGHPAVCSKSQFAYLWSRDYMIQKDYGKLRVLQRLANNFKGVSTSRGWNEKEWDDTISKILSAGGNDFAVYSAIRQKMIGSTLEKALEIDLGLGDKTASEAEVGCDHGSGGTLSEGRVLLGETIKSTTAGEALPTTGTLAGTTISAATAGKGGDGSMDERAGHMVSRFVDCIPSSLLSVGGTTSGAVGHSSISRVLDYGCAEGKITAEFARQLKSLGVSLKADDVFGADVRSVSTGGEFTFVALPPENPASPPKSGTLLADVAESSIDVVLASMVFHHVIHVEAVIKELRRVISSKGVLLLREHDCRSPDVGAFLDITHGLFSLAWCKEASYAIGETGL